MSLPQQIYISEYSYQLPECKIAKYPLLERDQSKLLVHRGSTITDSRFSSIASYLPNDSLLVFNNTKVIQARLHFEKETGAKIEIFCLEPHSPSDYLLNFQQSQSCSWICLIGNQRKWKQGKLHKKFIIQGKEIELTAEKIGVKSELSIIQFEWNNASILFSDLLEAIGELPIPPYLKRETEKKDAETYQTVYAKTEGSVAAPTAGLHFTDAILTSLKTKGIQTEEVTLHVGAGTFKPVKSEQLAAHEMHSECITVSAQLIETLLAHKGDVIAVGTTSVRTLESIYYIGESLENNHNDIPTVAQWQPYQTNSNKISVEKALLNILNYLNLHQQTILVASTQILIAPGYTFKLVDGIVTNFHQPQSTLLLLISAFVGENNWKHIYEYALNNNYRFLSYGDSSLLLKK